MFRVGFFDVNASYAQGLSLMVLFIFGFWLTVDLILGDINILKMLGVTPLVRQVRHLVEGFDAEQVPHHYFGICSKKFSHILFCR